MYSMARQTQQDLSPKEEAAKPPLPEDARNFDQFNEHILLTVRALNQLKSIFDVRGA